MAVISMKALLESGVHFGHRTHKWHPSMKPYIFTERNSIHIIDLQKTVKALEQAYNLVRDSAAEGGMLLFVGTKRQAQETIQFEAERCGMPYVTNRWLGGMLTNWRTIRQRVNELERLERMQERGDFSKITKKEALILSRKMERLEMLLGGIRKMTRLPDLLFIVDVSREETAIHEANLLNIPVIGLVDTNCDLRNVDYVIPSNDDAIRAIKLLVAKIADAVVEGHSLRKEEEEEFPEERVTVLIDEPELTDEELLGEATLAKISRREEISIDDEEYAEELEQDGEESEEEEEFEEEAYEEVEDIDEEIEVEEDEVEEIEVEEDEVEEIEVEEDEVEEIEVEEDDLLVDQVDEPETEASEPEVTETMDDEVEETEVEEIKVDEAAVQEEEEINPEPVDDEGEDESKRGEG
jgi:small subunit ribosomal protein S2